MGAARQTDAEEKVAAATIPPVSSDDTIVHDPEDVPAAFRAADAAADADADVPAPRRPINVPLVVSISLSIVGVILIAYLVILIFGARG